MKPTPSLPIESLTLQPLNGHDVLHTQARQLDTADTLAAASDLFELPEHVIYLDGNSLGPMPTVAKERAREVVENQWANSLISSWNEHDWIGLPKTVGAKIAKLIGAAPESVISCDSISVNLFKLLSIALKKNAGRTIVLSQNDNFPTDLYMVEGLQSLMGEQSIELMKADEQALTSLIELHGNNIAVLMLTHVNFRSGEIHDMKALTALAHKHGILTIWDLAHSAGVMPLYLDDNEVDFAVGCGYKYLNGGPGAPAFVYVNAKHCGDLSQPLSGWMGHANAFDFDPSYKGAADISQMLCGTPSVISMSVLDASLGVFEHASIDDIRQKSMAMTEFVRLAILQQAELSSFQLCSPVDVDVRGSQLAYQHTHAYQLCQCLVKYGVIADFRAPNILRLGFSPLFLSYQQCLSAIQILLTIMHTQEYLAPEFALRSKVT